MHRVPLHLTRIQAVPGYGPVTARSHGGGRSPGENEDREGKPFVGAAGRLLTSLLESVGLDRRDIYITNIVKCRPPRNRDPEPYEVDACSHFLDEQIELLQPDVILLLGRHALTRLLPGVGGISRLHGERLHRDDRVYVPLYHPAAALYNGCAQGDARGGHAPRARVPQRCGGDPRAPSRRRDGFGAAHGRRSAGGDQMELF